MEPENKKPAGEGKSTSGATGGDLAFLLSQLRHHANALPEREREVALEHVEKLHQEGAAQGADTLRMKVWLKGLETFPSLTPIVAQVLDALSNVGA